MISETTSTLYENVAGARRKVSVRSPDGVDCPSFSTLLGFDCDFRSGVRYCLAAQIESPVRKSVVGRGNKKGMSCVYPALSGVDLHDPP
ncbi:hypothetical protein AB0346_20765 [Nocardia beijingensis]|uniref:hypothetical protein n=1 Tax=Nocardia beijingensis TaxID=95162 RepID=UPI0033B88ED7